MKLPDFIIAGCGKAGTSALYQYLNEHPQVFMSKPKEPRYFAYPEHRPNYCGYRDEERFNATTVWRWNDYCSLFDEAGNDKIVGEASPIYMAYENVPKLISETLPEVKIIIMLRHPVERAYSAYLHQVRERCEQLSFEDALLAESDRTRQNWAGHWRYKALGFVADVLGTYVAVFPKGKLKIILYEDFKRDNQQVLKDVLSFLNIDDNFEFCENRANAGGIPRSYFLYKFLETPNAAKAMLKAVLPGFMIRKVTAGLKRKNLKRPIIRAETYNKLLDCFESDIRKTEEIIERDLSHWLYKR